MCENTARPWRPQRDGRFNTAGATQWLTQPPSYIFPSLTGRSRGRQQESYLRRFFLGLVNALHSLRTFRRSLPWVFHKGLLSQSANYRFVLSAVVRRVKGEKLHFEITMHVSVRYNRLSNRKYRDMY